MVKTSDEKQQVYPKSVLTKSHGGRQLYLLKV